MKKTLQNKIAEKIKEDNMKPTSRYHFLLKEVSLWTGTILALILASLSTGSIIFSSFNGQLMSPQLLIWFSILRITLIILFVILAVHQIVNSVQGYKRRKRSYLLIGLVLIGIFGSFTFESRLSGFFERNIGSAGLTEQVNRYWSDPINQGLLAGELKEVTNDGLLLLSALDGTIHIIDAQNIEPENQSLFIESLRVKMVGYENSGIFYPCSVAPWKLRGAGRESHPEYGNVLDGNINFAGQRSININFKKTFERKNSIIRTNSC